MTQMNLDQRRAAFAWGCVQGTDDKYATLAKGAPALIMNNGLMQALAFYEAKGKDHHRALASHLLRWLLRRGLVTGDEFGKAMDALVKADSATFRRATDEALALLRWIRQFAAAVQKTGASGREGT